MGWWPEDCAVGLRMFLGMWTSIWWFTAFNIHGLPCHEWKVLKCVPPLFGYHFCHIPLSLVPICVNTSIFPLYLFNAVDIMLLMWVPHRTSILINIYHVADVGPTQNQTTHQLAWSKLSSLLELSRTIMHRFEFTVQCNLEGDHKECIEIVFFDHLGREYFFMSIKMC